MEHSHIEIRSTYFSDCVHEVAKRKNGGGVKKYQITSLSAQKAYTIVQAQNYKTTSTLISLDWKERGPSLQSVSLSFPALPDAKKKKKKKEGIDT